jgi:S-adenosylmethionine decarboxylase
MQTQIMNLKTIAISLLFTYIYLGSSLLSEATLVQSTISNENLTSIQNVNTETSGKKVYHFFEGVEKLLEIWFTDNGSSPNATLRTIERKSFEKMVFKIGISILSVKKLDAIDAYVLSESSMFVMDRHIVIKTCGSSRLLKLLGTIMKLAEKCGLPIVQDLFFSRKNFLKPESQPAPHRSYQQETDYLAKYFSESGAAYTFGRSNQEHWNLYTLSSASGIPVPDQTIEVIMSDLSESTMAYFKYSYSSDPNVVSNASGIDSLFPGSIMDHYVFDPCGYSANGLISGDKYFTIHITPEKAFSFVSFETNYPYEDYQPLIRKVVDVFKPNKFVVTLISNEMSISKKAHSDLLRARGREVIKGFACNDLQYTLLKDNYELTYASFEKPQVTARAPPASCPLTALLFGIERMYESESSCGAEGCDAHDVSQLLDTQAGAKTLPVPALPVERASDAVQSP